MREILFRGKRIDNGEWVYGSHLHLNIGKDFICDGTVYIGTLQPCKLQVIPETVGQYTGLCDKNGKKIFEGDIVLTQEFTDKPHAKSRKAKRHTGVVQYCIGTGKKFYNEETGEWDKQKDYSAEWKVKVKDYDKYVCSSWGDFFDCEWDFL